MDKLRESWQALAAGTKRLLIILLVGAVAFAAVGAILLNKSNSKVEYTTLFTGLSQDEAQEIAGVITEQNVEYIYDAATGTIQVPKDQEDTLRAELLSQGYPKSGFTYSTYISNSGLMATESDKKQYTLYDLQDRLGATIRLFDGVQDAKVTIARGDSDSYVLNDDGTTNDGSNNDVSASVVVTMQQGSTLTTENADAIRNLIARSVNGLNFTSVSVFDAATMTEVGGNTDTDTATSQQVSDLTSQVEDSIAQNVKTVLGKIYDPDNIEVSVKGKLDTTNTVTEDTTYSVPVQSTSDDKVGLLSTEDDQTSYTGNDASNASGVAGTDSNADTPEYVVSASNIPDGTESFDTSTSRQWLYNQEKKQTTRSPGTLTDCTIAVVIDTDDTSIPEADLTNLIADAAGINRQNAANKISIVRRSITDSTTPTVTQAPTEETQTNQDLLRILIIAGAAALVVIVLLILLTSRRRKQKKAEEEAAEAEAAAEEEKRAAEEAAAAAEEKEKQEEEAKKAARAKQPSEEEIANNERVQRSMQLKDDIGKFIDDNPQAAAKLIQGWLREGEDKNGRQQYKK